MLNALTIWLTIGFLGQALFSARFIIQWLYSEKMGKSVIPMAFWYFSLGGGLLLTVYAIFWLKDPVFIVGQASGLFVYSRNLYLILKRRKKLLNLNQAKQVKKGAL